MTPPRVFDSLLRRLLPPGPIGDSMRGDLIEELATADNGPIARWRYMTAALSIALRYRRRQQVQPVDIPRRGPMERIRQDVKCAWRSLYKRPTLSAMVIVTLALGIGATTAIFSVVEGVLLRPLPFPQPEQLVQIFGALPARDIARASATEADAWDLRDLNRSFADFGIRHSASFTLSAASGNPQRVTGSQVSVGFFRVLGVAPAAGRLFANGEDDPGAPGNLALLSHALWVDRFAANPGIVGQAINLDGRSYQVVGVLPAGTPWLDISEVFVPFVRRTNPDRSSWEYLCIGRLKPGVTLDGARSDLTRLGRELEATYPKTNRGLTFTLQPSREWAASDNLRRTLWTMLGAVGVLLLIASVNVTNLLLAHASARVREIAVRTALGARRGDLIRERLTESTIYSLVGAGLGGLVAFLMLRTFKAFDPGGIPRLAEAQIDIWVLAFTIAIAGLIGVLTGIVPALGVTAGRTLPAMQQGQRGTIGDRRNDRVRSVFVAVEVALSLMLLVGAGLLVKSLVRVLAVERGFATEQRLLATVSVPSSYSEERRTQIATTLLARLEAMPQITSVAVVSGRPLAGGSTGLGIVAADHPEIPEAKVPWATWRIVTKDYFRTMGLTLLAGRGFDEHDIIQKPWRVVISKRLADLLWRGENPIGKTAVLWKGQGNRPAEVIGVVSNMRERGLENDPTLAVYFPAYGALGATTLQLVMHTRGEPETFTPTLRSAVAEIDSTLPVSGVRTLEELVTRSVATRKFTMLLIVVFAALAIVLATAGVYGVLAYSVARRTAEIGVRLALGAAPARVLRRVFSRGMRPVILGLAVGLVGMYWLSRLMTTLLFDIEPRDLSTYLITTSILLVVAALACYLPARRVLRVDPAIALRVE